MEFCGLVEGPGQPLIRKMDQLAAGKAYIPMPRGSSRGVSWQPCGSALDSQSPHLHPKCGESEFGAALASVVSEVEGVPPNAAKLLPHARTFWDGVNDEVLEVDAVVVVDTAAGRVAYIGSHKPYTDGTADAMSALADAGKVEAMVNNPTIATAPELQIATTFKAAFMAEALGPEAAVEVLDYCREEGVLLLSRSDGSIARVA
ncbi:hypothetical protein HYH03_016085 [Edaphochlamys debaryana]|uniref:Uncharacterized protein n=1 Tax=Edaphochlamys debaryana TaxID=47281 RepID=A0A835XN11_9CHLO|nr:hypothetical protein HYH03_016085 [Edaphochlamys debaryana]|eukprot:KAG2485196.1 hypothetical protein HYH03_016085 [Edaphochlamys debaryana]